MALFGMGATLSVAQFAEVFRTPKSFALGLTVQWLYVPALAIAFTYAFDLSAGWAVGLCLVAAVPGGAFSNLLTFFSRGNIALSIAVCAITTATCIFTV